MRREKHLFLFCDVQYKLFLKLSVQYYSIEVLTHFYQVENYHSRFLICCEVYRRRERRETSCSNVVMCETVPLALYI
jgi:hypothetical protein